MEQRANVHAMQSPVWAGAPLSEASLVAIMVHGRTQTPAFMLEQFRRLDIPTMACVLPAAAGNTWYPGGFMEHLDKNEPYLSNAHEVLRNLVDDLNSRGVPSGRIALIGFSQGACLVSDFLLQNPARYAALIAWTGGFIGPEGTDRSGKGRLDGVPAFIGCSDVDPWIPLDRAKETAALLRSLGAEVTEVVYPGKEHVVCDDEIQQARGILLEAARSVA